MIINYPYNEGRTEPLAQIEHNLMEKADISYDASVSFGYNKAHVTSLDGAYLLTYWWPDEQNHIPLLVHTGLCSHFCRRHVRGAFFASDFFLCCLFA